MESCWCYETEFGLRSLRRGRSSSEVSQFLPSSCGSACQMSVNWRDGYLRIAPSCTTIEGGEGGGDSRSVSASKRCRPQPGKLPMHLWEERHRGRVLRTSGKYPEKPVVQPRGLGTRWRSPLEPYPLSGPGKHSRHFRIRLRHYYRQSSSTTEFSSPECSGSPSDAEIDIQSPGGPPRILLARSLQRAQHVPLAAQLVSEGLPPL